MVVEPRSAVASSCRSASPAFRAPLAGPGTEAEPVTASRGHSPHTRSCCHTPGGAQGSLSCERKQSGHGGRGRREVEPGVALGSREERMLFLWGILSPSSVFKASKTIINVTAFTVQWLFLLLCLSSLWAMPLKKSFLTCCLREEQTKMQMSQEAELRTSQTFAYNLIKYMLLCQ